jgi:hypothetical protein
VTGHLRTHRRHPAPNDANRAGSRPLAGSGDQEDRRPGCRDPDGGVAGTDGGVGTVDAGGVVDLGGGVGWDGGVGVGTVVGGCGRVGRGGGGVGRVVEVGGVDGGGVVVVGRGGVVVVGRGVVGPRTPGAPGDEEPRDGPGPAPAPPAAATGTAGPLPTGAAGAGTDAAGAAGSASPPSSPGPGSGARCARRSTCGPDSGAAGTDDGPRSAITGVTTRVGSTAGPCGVGVEDANRLPRVGAIAREVEVPVTVWKTAVLTAAAPMIDTPATATRRRRAPSPLEPPTSRIRAAPPTAVLGSTVSSCCSRTAASPGGGHGTRAPALGPGAVY